MFAIHRWASEEQKQYWLPRMAAGDALGCFGLTEPDFGSNPGDMRTSARRDGSDWVMTARRCGSPTAASPMLRRVGANRRRHPRIRRFRPTPKDLRPIIERKLSLRASITSELVLDNCRVPGEAAFPEVARIARSARVSERSAVRHRLGRDGRGAQLLRDRARVFEDPRAVRPADRRLSAHAGEARQHDARVNKGTLLALHIGRMKDRRAARIRRTSASAS